MKRNSSSWILPEEASKMLGISPEGVVQLADNGLIRKLVDEDQVFININDLEGLSNLQGVEEQDEVSLTQRVILLEAQVKRLTESFDILFQANYMSSSKFNSMTDEDLLILYRSIENQVDRKIWTIPKILSFCEVFLRISEVEIEQLNDLTKQTDCWKPFYELCLKLANFINNHPDLSTNIEVQRCRDLLAYSRKNLRSIAVIFIELAHKYGPPHKLLAATAAADLDMFDITVKKFVIDRKAEKVKTTPPSN